MVKASAQITLTYVIEIAATYRYYLLQSSTLSKPAVPTKNPPGGSWNDTEPAYASGSTNSLYYVDLTVYSDNSFTYSSVSLSSSYEAAKEAYNKAVNAQSSVDRNYDKVGSRGEQLITNGNGLLGDNTNFSQLIFDGAVANNSPASFTKDGRGTVVADEFIPINPQKRYTLRLDAKTKNGLSSMYCFLNCYDADKLTILPNNYLFVPGTLTTLARDLKNGDTVVYLSDVSAWQYKQYYKYIFMWNYANSFGYTYPAETYTRNSATIANTSSTPNDGAIDSENNTITLQTAWSGDTVPAGTQVSQGRDGSTYIYIGMYGKVIPSTWTTFESSRMGISPPGEQSGFPAGLAYCKLGFLWNYNNADDQTWVTNITLQDTTADNDLSNKITKTNTRIDQTNNKITLECATKTEVTTQISSAVNDIEVGGRNLLLNSNVEVSNNEYNTHGYAPSSPLVAGEEYTFSICFTPAPGVTQLRGYLSSGYIVLGRIDVTSTERQTAHFTFTANYANGRTPDVNAIYGYFNIFRFPNDGTVTENTTIHWVKCEKGNKPTDWTPAPEDVDADIEDNAAAANENIEKAKQDAIDTSQSNMEETLKGYSTTTEVQKLISDTKGELELTDNQFSVRFEATERSIGDVNGILNPLVENVNKHFDFSLEDGLIIQTNNGLIRLRLDNDVIAFEKQTGEGWAPFGSWDGDYFHTGNIVVKTNERAQFGNFAFVPRNNGSLSLLKVGG